ncbi:MAG: hypothetical protein AAB587_01785 [Patescibacteria group bacterium]
MRNLKAQRGYILLNTIVYASIALIITTAFVSWSSQLMKSIKYLTFREQAFQIAEAGVDYYRWHLAHAPSDFQDGTGAPGPYAHDFYDKDGNLIGQFILTITPPAIGSTLVTVLSKGNITSPIAVSRTLEARLAIPSLAQYAVVANAAMRFGAGTEVSGPIHSNGGIRFDGLAHNIVSSSQNTYTDTDGDACTGNSWGVHTCVNPDDPAPNTVPPARPDVFEAGRQYPIAPVDFVGITSDLSNMKALAQAAGRYFAASGAQGYRILLKTNDTFDIYRVNSLTATPSNCSSTQTNWGTWSIAVGGDQFLANYANPANGIIFVEDHLWIEGQINTARLTIAAGRFPDDPSQRRDITFNNDLLYTDYTGLDVISLIAQRNINVGMVSDTDLRIDAALVAQNGRVGRFYYRAPGGGQNRCSPYHTRNSIILFGMIASNQRYGFAYTDGTGYITRNITYDGNLLYAPPPSFPLTSSQYSIISWREI